MSGEKVKEPAEQAQGLTALLHGIRSVLRFHQAVGIAEYPLDENVQQFLRATGPSALPGGARSPGARPVARMQMSPAAEVAVPGKEILESLPDEIRRCTLCPLATAGWGRVLGQGQAGSLLMVVGDWSQQTQAFSPATLFGPEEDIMLAKMMEAIGLRLEDIYVSNVLKCSPGSGPAEPAWCRNCFSFLLREIDAVRPLLICAMGEVAVSLLLGSSEPLFRLRGRFALSRYQTSPPIPVMPTFHPRYLLSSPEMKMATWKDLQAVRRRLDQLSKASKGT